MRILPSIPKILGSLIAVLLSYLVYIVCWSQDYLPVHYIAPPQQPLFSDDLDQTSLKTCLLRQREWLDGRGKNVTFIFGDEIYDSRLLLHSIDIILAKIDEHFESEEFTTFIRNNFTVYQAGGRKDQKQRRMLVTGYYEPLFHGSPKKVPPYIYPIYSVPPSLITRTENGKKTIGQISPEGRFVDFWTRRDIESKNLLAGYELAYLRDPFDAFLLHVQGSGRLQFPDGSLHAVGFAGSNGLEYMSIGKLLVEQQKMDLAEVNVPAIRQYLNEHPNERTDILNHNPRYIFFTWSNSDGPKGSSQCVLTPGRSVAIDNAALPPGTVGYLESRKPVLNQQNEIIAWEKFGRFVCPQDTGSAIKGTGRIDIFWGNGDYAEIAASHMKEDGALYFLIAKD